jgi:Fic-DOC domain mobile mystery protein B
MTPLFAEPADATPLAPAERDGLKQNWITHRGELNAAEQHNILKGLAWAKRKQGRSAPDLLNDEFARRLHRAMFGDVWTWAGKYRQTERNIGIAARGIPEAIIVLFGDAQYWINEQTFPPDEIAVRLHHRLVAIHPFPNGNGRHSRFMADLLIEILGGLPFSWGKNNFADASELRASYIAALRAADNHIIGPLIFFARA